MKHNQIALLVFGFLTLMIAFGYFSIAWAQEIVYLPVVQVYPSNPPTPTATPTPTTTPTPSLATWHYEGKDPPVSFDLREDDHFCNFKIVAPYGFSTCTMKSSACLPLIDGNTLLIPLVTEDSIAEINGKFTDDRSRIDGDYKITMCNGSLIISPQKPGNWEAHDLGPPTPTPTPDSGKIPSSGTWECSFNDSRVGLDVVVKFTISPDGKSVSGGLISMACSGEVSIPGPTTIDYYDHYSGNPAFYMSPDDYSSGIFAISANFLSNDEASIYVLNAPTNSICGKNWSYKTMTNQYCAR